MIGLVAAFGYTDAGHRTLLAIAVPVAEKTLAGHLRIGRLDGGLLSHLALSDVELEDAEGRVAVSARRLDARYDLFGLLTGTIDLVEIGGQGVRVDGHPLTDGRLNLAALTRPSDAPPPATPSAPIHLRIDRVKLDAEVRWAAGKAPLDRIAAAVVLDGSFGMDGDRMAIEIDALDVTAREPAAATLHAGGGVHFQPDPRLEGLSLDLTTDGAAVEKLLPAGALPGGHLHGPLRVAVSAHGSLDALEALAHLTTPRGTVDVKGSGDVTRLLWKATLAVRDLDPSASWTLPPPATLGLDATASGRGGEGEVRLGGLTLRAAGVEVSGSGRASLDGQVDASVHVSSPDLRTPSGLTLPELSGFPKLPKLFGALDVRAHGVRRGNGGLALDATISGSGLAAPAFGARLDRLHVQARAAEPGRSELAVEIAGVHAAGQSLRTMSLQASGTRSALELRLAAALEGAIRVTLATHLQPTWRDGSLVGGAGTFEQLTLAVRGRDVHLAKPARFSVGDDVRVTGLALATGDQTLELDGSYRLANGAIAAELRAARLDLRELASLAAPASSAQLPHTRLDAMVHLSGSAAAPLADASIEGQTAPHAPLALGPMRHHLVVHYGDGRARGEVHMAPDSAPSEPSAIPHAPSMTMAGSRLPPVALQAFHGTTVATVGTLLPLAAHAVGDGRLSADLRFDVPVQLARDAPIEAELRLDAPAVDDFQRLLPAALSTLRGRAGVTSKIGGTLRHPEIDLAIDAPSWAYRAFTNSAAAIALRFADQKLDLTASIDLARGDERLGSLRSTVSAPLSLDPLALPPDLVERITRHTPVTAQLSFAGFDFARFPFAAFGVTAPAQAGLLDGTIAVSGTGSNPTLAVDLTARDLSMPSLKRPIGARIRAGWAGDKLHLEGEVAAAARALLSLRGDAALRFAELLDGKPWQDTPLSLTLDLPGFDLDLVPAEAAGMLRGRIALTGLAGRPSADAQLSVAGLHYQEFSLGDVTLRTSGDFDGARAQVKLALAQSAGGDLAMDASVPLGKTEEIVAAVQAHGFDLGFLAAAVPALEKVDARLDGQVALGGSRERPRVDGELSIKNGTVRFDDAPDPYKNLDLDARIHDGELKLQLSTLVGDAQRDAKTFGISTLQSKLKAAFSAKLDGLRPTRVDGTVDAQHFPLAQGEMVAHLDAKVRIEGDANPKEAHGLITIDSGALHLPKIESQPDAQKLDALSDVTFIDVAARKAKELADAAAAAAAVNSGDTQRLSVQAKLPGPFYVRGPDVSGDLTGDVAVGMGKGPPRVQGAVDFMRGTVQISERPYKVETARAIFDGDGDHDIDPNLEVRLTREIEGSTIVIVVGGTASRPELDLSCDPPVYDQTTLLTMIATGASAPSEKSDKPVSEQLEAKAIGAVSGMLVNKLKDELGGYLPIEVLKFDLGMEGMNAAPNARLEVGKYILDNLYVSYVYQNAPPAQRKRNSHEAHLEYSFLRDFSVVATGGDQAVGALDLYWNWRF